MTDLYREIATNALSGIGLSVLVAILWEPAPMYSAFSSVVFQLPLLLELDALHCHRPPKVTGRG